jgi:ABC-2 type transport system ATP-binding protein
MKVLDNLVFFGTLRGMRPAAARAAALTWLDRVKLENVTELKLQELSKGNQQKVQFVATVLHDPDLLVLDEPFSGLDPVNQDLIRATILELARSGTTVVLSTHLMDEVERLCSHLTLIHQGRCVVEGTLDDVKRAHGGEIVHLELTGDSEFVDSLPFVRDVRRIGRRLEIRLADGWDESALLETAAARAGVRHFEVRAASLHSIFVDLVSPAVGDAAAEAARSGTGPAEEAGRESVPS